MSEPGDSSASVQEEPEAKVPRRPSQPEGRQAEKRPNLHLLLLVGRGGQLCEAELMLGSDMVTDVVMTTVQNQAHGLTSF